MIRISNPIEKELEVSFLVGGRPEQEHRGRVLEQRHDAQEYEHGNAERAERVGYEPAELLYEQRGDDHAHAAERVGEHVQEHAVHVVVVGRAERGRRGRRDTFGRVGGVRVAVAVRRGRARSVTMSVAMTTTAATAATVTVLVLLLLLGVDVGVGGRVVAGARHAAVCVRVSEDDNAEHVDAEASKGDVDELLALDLGRLEEAMHGLDEHEQRDDDEEEAVDEAREDLESTVAVRERLRWLPLADHGGEEAHDERRAVEQHVHAVRDETERVGESAVGELDKRERQVDAQEVEDVTRVGVRDYLAQDALDDGEHGHGGALERLAGQTVEGRADGRVADEAALVRLQRLAQHVRAQHEEHVGDEHAPRQRVLLLHHRAYAVHDGHAHHVRMIPHEAQCQRAREHEQGRVLGGERGVRLLRHVRLDVEVDEVDEERHHHDRYDEVVPRVAVVRVHQVERILDREEVLYKF